VSEYRRGESGVGLDETPLFVVEQVGFDDVTLGFQMQGAVAAALNEREGVTAKWAKRLGSHTSWGEWVSPLGRSAAFWKAETARLYVQAKLAPEGQLVRPAGLGVAVAALMARMAVCGWTTFEPVFVTRADIAVDAVCAPSSGKALLDALEAVRLPNGWRTQSFGSPRSTVYFTAARSERKLARAYCRNLKRRQGAPFGRIRLEATHSWKANEWPLTLLQELGCARLLWESRYGSLSQRVTRLSREDGLLKLTERVARGEISCSQAERMHAYIDAERLGVAATLYSQGALRARRREARQLGIASNDSGLDAVELELHELLAPFAQSFDK